MVKKGNKLKTGTVIMKHNFEDNMEGGSAKRYPYFFSMRL